MNNDHYSVSFRAIKNLLHFVIEHQHQRATNTPPEIAQVAFEEPSEAFFSQDLSATVEGSLVLSL